MGQGLQWVLDWLGSERWLNKVWLQYDEQNRWDTTCHNNTQSDTQSLLHQAKKPATLAELLDIPGH